MTFSALAKRTTTLLLFSFLVTIPACDRATLAKLPVVGKFFAPPMEEVNLTYWGLWEEKEILTPLLEDFVQTYQSQNPYRKVTVTYEKRSFSTLEQYKETLLTRLKQGTGPDVFRLHNSWVSPFSSELAPLPSQIISEADYKTAFYPAAFDSSGIGGKIYALPLEYEGLLLLYNKDMLTNEQTALLGTWEGVRQVAVAQTQREQTAFGGEGKILKAGLAMGTASNVVHAADILSLLFLQSGADPLTGLETQAAQDALTFYTNFARVDRVWDSTLPSSITAFANGLVAMIFAPSYRVLDIKKLAPDLKIGAVPVPQLPTLEQTKISFATFWMEAVSKDSAYPDVAWELLKFLSQPENLETFHSRSSQIRPFGEPYPRRDMAERLKDHDLLGALYVLAEVGKTAKTTDSSGNKPYVDVYGEAIADVLSPTPQLIRDILAKAQKALNQLEGR